MSIDILSMWDFSQPEASETRFRQAMQTASPDERLCLQTQVARAHGLRGDFTGAARQLEQIAAQIPGAGPEAQVRYHLELGRAQASAAHPPAARTPEALAAARQAYTRAFELAQAAGLDYLAVDALHMLAITESAPADQQACDRRALEYMQVSAQPEAKKWEASLRNNLGYALALGGQHDEALEQFRLALAARERAGDAGNIRVAWWMIAWALRLKGQRAHALEIQLRLEAECEAASAPDRYVFEELVELYRALGDEPRAQRYAEKLAAAGEA